MKQNCFFQQFFAFILILTVIFTAFSGSTVQADSDPYPYNAFLPVVYIPFVPSSLLGDLGTIKYTLDGASMVSGKYTNDGTPLQLSVTDAAGVIWTLTVPDGALLVPQQITMTAFSSIDASQAQFAPTSGVSFQPDGLQFTAPATLTMTFPDNPAGFGVIFIANQDGSYLQFAQTSMSGGSAATPIWHFSSAGGKWVDPNATQEIQKLQQMASEQYLQALKQANQFIQAGAPTPPSPPTLTMQCLGTSAGQDIVSIANQYTKAFLQPYMAVTQPLLATSRTLELLNGSFDPSEAMAKSAVIAKMALDKAVELGNQVKTEQPPDRLFVIVNTALQAKKALELFGGTGSEYNETIKTWVIDMWSYYYHQLRAHDDYRLLSTLFVLGRDAVRLGADNLANYAENIMSALYFTVDIDPTFDGILDIWTEGHFVQTGTYSKFLGYIDDQFRPHWTTDGMEGITMMYVSGTLDGRPMINPGLTYDSSIEMVNFDACVTRQTEIYMLTMGSYDEQFNHDGTIERFGFCDLAAYQAYADMRVEYPNDPMGYRFTLQLNEQGQIAVDDTITRTVNGLTISTHIHMTHNH